MFRQKGEILCQDILVLLIENHVDLVFLFLNHGHITVNGKKVDIPSYRVKPGDVISVKDSDKELAIIKSSLEATHSRVEYITYDDKKMVATYVRYPERSELNADINESLIVEFYNR